MLRIVKWGGVTVGAGALVGLGVVAWMVTQKPAAHVASVQPGLVPFSTASATPVPNDGLQVLSATDVTSQLGAAGGNLSGTAKSGDSSSSAGGSASSSRASSVPGPSDFKQYEIYATKTTALFGDIVAGTGPAVAAGSTVTVQYRGWLTNGTEVDESYAGGKPFSFVEGQHKVVAGWEEGLFGMKVGGTRRVIVPPAAGYGDKANGPIPANAVLVFDIELVGVQ